jgi:hypothetical protein
MRIHLPVKVQGYDGAGPWLEMTATEDASSGGLAFSLRRPAKVGNVLLLELPLPKQLRRHALSDPCYRVYALVRTVKPRDGATRVGVLFLGKNPPKDFLQNPTGLYLLPCDPDPTFKERRQYRRLDIFLNFRIRRLDPNGIGPQEEQTVAENLSKRGARVLTSMACEKGETVAVEELGGDFKTRAEVRNVYIGKDNIPRLNLYFLDGEAPDRLISSE